MRVRISCRAALTAAFIAEAIWPDGLGTTVIRLSAAASSRAMASVRSLEGPMARTSSNPPGYSWPRTAATDSARCFSSLSTGMTTETAGSVADSPAE